jgi:hypothetical protein
VPDGNRDTHTQDTLQTTPAEEEEADDEAESLLFPLLVLAQRFGLDTLTALCEGYIREVRLSVVWICGGGKYMSYSFTRRTMFP